VKSAIGCLSKLCGLRRFLYCCFSFSIWYAIFKWLGLLLIMPPNLFYLFDCLCGAAVGKNRRKGYQLIWHATVWLIWKARNDIIFNNEIKDERAVAEGIKVLSWRWGLASLNLSPCLLYEWCAEPNLCLDM
jgi:hypothetical protein